MTMETKVLQSRRSVTQNLSLLLTYRELVYTWTVREIRARYRQSALGFGWAVITPVVQMVVISIIFGGFLGVSSPDGIPYPVFTYIAILPWTLFTGQISAAVPSVLANMQLVTKIYFPREILPLSAGLGRLVDFAVATLIFVGLAIWYDLQIHSTWLLIPLLLFIQIVFALGIGLLGAAISVFLRDISFAIPLLMQLWMYATPIIYPLSEVPDRILPVYMLNPMAGIITAYRAIILEGQLPDWGYLGYATAVSIVLFIIAYLYFKRLEMAMSDII